MELGYRIDDRPGLCERDVRDILRTPTAGGEDDQHQADRDNHSCH